MSPNTPANAQDLITQLVQAASDETRLKKFLLANLAEAAVCSLAPRYDLDKTQAIQRISEIFAMASGGTSSTPRRLASCRRASCPMGLPRRSMRCRSAVRLSGISSLGVWRR